MKEELIIKNYKNYIHNCLKLVQNDRVFKILLYINGI